MHKYLLEADGRHLVFNTKEQALKQAILQQRSIKGIKSIQLKTFTTDELNDLFKTTLHHLDNQHSLQSAILLALNKRLHDDRNVVISAEIRNGNSIGKALWPFVPNYLKSMLANLKQPNGEEPKVAVIKSTSERLSQEQALSSHFVKHLGYPILISQSALVMATINAFLNDSNVMLNGLLWAAISALQTLLSIFIKKGSLARYLIKHVGGFRYQNTLGTVIALIESGESIQYALKVLCKYAHPRDKNALYTAMLKLEAGYHVQDCLPQQWFKRQQASSQLSIKNTSDILTPLNQAKDAWTVANRGHVNLLCKMIPIFGIVIAALFVAYTLVQLYLPLMDINRFGN